MREMRLITMFHVMKAITEGASNVSIITKRAPLAFSTVYKCVCDLEERGLVTKIRSGREVTVTAVGNFNSRYALIKELYDEATKK
jgi:predicted transcriptional regulator